jgi:hypothetical protein
VPINTNSNASLWFVSNTFNPSKTIQKRLNSSR